EKAGGHILQQTRVSDVTEIENGLLEIETSKGKITARNIIYATHIPPGVNVLHFKCAPYRTYAMAVTLNNNEYPESVVYDMLDPYHYYRTHEINGQKVLIAGGNDHKTGEEPNTEHIFTELEAYLRKYFSIKEIAFKWSSQFFDPIDGLPYIGHLPGNPSNVYVETGYGGNGITYSQIAAQLMNDIILGKENELEDLFKPSRVKPVAGFSNFIKDAADVIGHLISAPFPGDKIKEITELAKDEARVINYENKKLAIYKDENGKLFPLNPACTHIKCEVAFNTTEKVWECPCHGSRFSINGEMYTGPARKDMEVINLHEDKSK
ncbi:MAG: FAD-dependent oxidoreductase, partial [Ferruginibacter sp.]